MNELLNSDLLDMGKHENFIWLSYGVTFLVIIVLGIVSWRRHLRLKNLITKLKEKKKEDQK